MSVKQRLRLSFIAMLLIPVILSFTASIIITSVYINHYEFAYNMKFKGNPFKEFMDKGSPVFMDIKLISSTNVENLQDLKYIQDLDKKLEAMNAGIIIRKNDGVIYTSKNLQNLEIIKELPKFGSFIEERRFHNKASNLPYMMKQHDFYFKDGSTGSVFLILDTAVLTDALTKLGIILMVVIIAIFILTNGCITYLVSRSIVKPLEVMKYGANQIKEGNLDFHIEACSSDEIGQLTSTFEEMRSKLKESVETQVQYENNRKELISSISHDLKTPVTAIKGYVEGIMDGVADTPEKMEKYLKTIYAKANAVDKLIDELFLYSKLDLKKLPFNFEAIDIISYMKDIFEELQFDLDKNSIGLTVQGDMQQRIMVRADRESLRRVIINIIDNAVKYKKKQEAEINISVKNQDNNVLIEIRDNGEGMDEKELPQIFESFYRIDPSRNTSKGGSGLGLSIAKHIIEEHGGKIWAESKINAGTSIYFTLIKV